MSAKGQADRVAALEGLHEKLSSLERDEYLINRPFGQAGIIEPDESYARELTKSFSKRMEKVRKFETVVDGARAGSLNRLLTAEVLAREIWWSIHYEKSEGVYSKSGLLERVQHRFREGNFRGGKDKDTLRKNWGEYRGVAHIGAAMMICEELKITGREVVLFAEEIRFALSHENPRGTKEPYVPEVEQITFRLDTEF